jgi:hypothetical protein
MAHRNGHIDLSRENSVYFIYNLSGYSFDLDTLNLKLKGVFFET